MKVVTHQQLLKELIASYGNVTLTANNLGISRQAIYKRLEKNKDLREAVEESKKVFLDVAQLVILNKLKGNNLTAAIFVINKLGHLRGWGETLPDQIDPEQKSKIDQLLKAINTDMQEIKTDEDPTEDVEF